ncbi:MAG: hypothetical protein GX820_03165 [Bacteroidales bacterium]|nr:hypothetical protein [Bacteroidales bacterium]
MGYNKLKNGAKVWYFPDGYLPQKTDSGSMESHEALVMLNTNQVDANIFLDFYFEDKLPIKDIKIIIQSERVLCIRLDHPDEIGKIVIPPLCQYAIRVRSDVPIVAQFGRLDATQPNLAYYTTMGFFENT